MNSVLADLRFGARSLRRRPAYALVAVVTLAIGIGASTAMFSIAHGVVFEPLPFPESDRLVRVYDTFVEHGSTSGMSSPANFADWREQQRSFAALASYNPTTLTYTGLEPALSLTATSVSAEWADVLGVAPAVGRSFQRSEETLGNHRVLILSHGLWQRQFGGDAAIVGKQLSFEGAPYTVVGVMPKGFAFPTRETELWTPLAYDFDVSTSRGVHYIVVVGRLRTQTTLAQARAEMNLLMRRMERAHPEQLRGWGVRLASLHESVVGDVENRVILFLGAVGLLLLVACVNVANLSLAHAITRFRELAVRAAMGAGRWRLARQVTFEGITIALVAGIAGIGLAGLTIKAVIAFAPQSVPRLDAVRLDVSVVLFATALSLLSGLLVGAVPVFRAARSKLFESLQEGARTAGAGRATQRLRAGFVVAQVALAVVLAVGAGLLVKSFARLTDVDAGVRTQSALVATVTVPRSRYPDAVQRAQFFLDYVERLKGVPGVSTAAATTQLPLEGYSLSFAFWLPGKQVAMSDRPSGDFRVVSPGYFEALGIPLRRGRTFSAADRRGSPPVIVIDEALARRYFPNQDPIGKRIHVGFGDDDTPREIIGVVSDVRQRALGVPPQPGFYISLTQETWSTMRVVVRTTAAPPSLADVMRRELAAMDPLIPLRNVSTLDERVAASVVVPRFNSLLLATFAALAVLLAASGIYSVMSYSVTQRTREIGVRMALGARASHVQRGVWRSALGLGLVGGSIGVAIAFAAAPLLGELLFEVDVHDPQILLLPPLLFLGVAWLGSYVPARRASRVDAVVALRADG